MFWTWKTSRPWYEQRAADEVGQQERAQVADVRPAIDGRTAGVDAGPARLERLDRLDLPRERVAKAQRHRAWPAARPMRVARTSIRSAIRAAVPAAQAPARVPKPSRLASWLTVAQQQQMGQRQRQSPDPAARRHQARQGGPRRGFRGRRGQPRPGGRPPPPAARRCRSAPCGPGRRPRWRPWRGRARRAEHRRGPGRQGERRRRREVIWYPAAGPGEEGGEDPACVPRTATPAGGSNSAACTTLSLIGSRATAALSRPVPCGGR